MSNSVKIIECPRDAWQGLPVPIPSEIKADVHTIAVLGAGKIGEVLLSGLLRAGWPVPRLLAFSLAAHLVFSLTRALLGVVWLPAAYLDLRPGTLQPE